MTKERMHNLGMLMLVIFTAAAGAFMFWEQKIETGIASVLPFTYWMLANGTVVLLFLILFSWSHGTDIKEIKKSLDDQNAVIVRTISKKLEDHEKSINVLNSTINHLYAGTIRKSAEVRLSDRIYQRDDETREEFIKRVSSTTEEMLKSAVEETPTGSDEYPMREIQDRVERMEYLADKLETSITDRRNTELEEHMIDTALQITNIIRAQQGKERLIISNY